MSSEGKSLNFVLFDLSKLDVASAAAFLADRATRTGAEALPRDSRCHWILHPARGVDLLAAPGVGPEFLRGRLSLGDALFCTNPTGFDWNYLFPSEAHREVQALRSLVTHPAYLFLENTPQAPGWPVPGDAPVFRATPEGLSVVAGDKHVLLDWATKDTRPHRGVWWIIPGQVLLTGLPDLPWGHLPEALPGLWTGSGTPLPHPQEAPTPAGKIAAHEIGLLRRETTPTPLHQAILFRTQEYPGLGTKEAVDFEEALGGIRKRSLVANMQGQSELTEAGLRVRFQGGRLIEVTDVPSKTTLCEGADSYMEWGGTRHPFVVNSAFSFSGDYSWGLRQSLVLNDDDLLEPGRAIVDYYFVEESREFFVAATVRWPRWKAPVTVTRWAVAELTLFDLPGNGPLNTRVVWPDGQTADSLHRGGAGVLEGTDFVFAGGKASLVLGYPQNQTPRPHLLPWKLVRQWSRTRLVVNPEGGHSPRRSGEFEGLEEHFSFYLTQAEGAKLPFTVTRKQAVELIPPYVAPGP